MFNEKNRFNINLEILVLFLKTKKPSKTFIQTYLDISKAVWKQDYSVGDNGQGQALGVAVRLCSLPCVCCCFGVDEDPLVQLYSHGFMASQQLQFESNGLFSVGLC